MELLLQYLGMRKRGGKHATPLLHYLISSFILPLQDTPFRIFEQYFTSIQKVILQVADRIWPVKIASNSHFGLAKLTSGWIEFARTTIWQKGMYVSIKAGYSKEKIDTTTSVHFKMRSLNCFSKNHSRASMASSKQSCNGRSYFTNESPHFMKIILQENLQNGKLEIPIDFIKKYGNGMSSQTLLRVPSGEVWKVELSKRDGKVWLKKGLQEFSKHYSLEHGQFVVFRYQGNSIFHVAILDRTATEIQYPSTSNYHADAELKGILEESESDDSIEIIKEIPPAPSRKFREKLQVPCPRPRKKMTSSDSAKKTDEVNLKSQGMAPQNGGPAMKVDESTKTLRAGGRFCALQRAAKAFQSKHPFFVLVMQPSYVGLTKTWQLALPAPFVRKHNLIKEGNGLITLCNKNGETWHVKVRQGVSGKAVCSSLQAGWDVFVQENDLQLGDVCAFELINSIETTLKVVKMPRQGCKKSSSLK